MLKKPGSRCRRCSNSPAPVLRQETAKKGHDQGGSSDFALLRPQGCLSAGLALKPHSQEQARWGLQLTGGGGEGMHPNTVQGSPCLRELGAHSSGFPLLPAPPSWPPPLGPGGTWQLFCLLSWGTWGRPPRGFSQSFPTCQTHWSQKRAKLLGQNPGPWKLQVACNPPSRIPNPVFLGEHRSAPQPNVPHQPSPRSSGD